MTNSRNSRRNSTKWCNGRRIKKRLENAKMSIRKESQQLYLDYSQWWIKARGVSFLLGKQTNNFTQFEDRYRKYANIPRCLDYVSRAIRIKSSNGRIIWQTALFHVIINGSPLSEFHPEDFRFCRDCLSSEMGLIHRIHPWSKCNRPSRIFFLFRISFFVRAKLR